MLKKRISLRGFSGYLDIPKPTLTRDETGELRDLFNQYDNDKKGRVFPKDFLQGLRNLGFETKCRNLYEIVEILNTPENNEKGIVFSDFLDAFYENFGTTNDKKEIRRLFELFLKEKDSDSIFLGDLKRTSEEIGMVYDKSDLISLLKQISALKNELTFDEFYIMLTDKLIITG
jgi:Ca2+-binding EF-hand superfamily protein